MPYFLLLSHMVYVVVVVEDMILNPDQCNWVRAHVWTFDANTLFVKNRFRRFSVIAACHLSPALSSPPPCSRSPTTNTRTTQYPHHCPFLIRLLDTNSVGRRRPISGAFFLLY